MRRNNAKMLAGGCSTSWKGVFGTDSPAHFEALGGQPRTAPAQPQPPPAWNGYWPQVLASSRASKVRCDHLVFHRSDVMGSRSFMRNMLFYTTAVRRTQSILLSPTHEHEHSCCHISTKCVCFWLRSRCLSHRNCHGLAYPTNQH